jgi:hypothetical protein
VVIAPVTTSTNARVDSPAVEEMETEIHPYIRFPFSIRFFFYFGYNPFPKLWQFPVRIICNIFLYSWNARCPVGSRGMHDSGILFVINLVHDKGDNGPRACTRLS